VRRVVRESAWLAAAGGSAYACWLAGGGATPIDRALPLLAVIVTLLAWSAELVAVQSAAPLLLVASVTLPDERLRLLAYGVILAIAFGAAAFAAREPRRLGIALAAVALLRWIPTSDVIVWREALILAAAYLVFRTTRSAVAAALVAVATPLFPLKALALPLFVAAIAAVRRRGVSIAAAIACAAVIPFIRYSFAPMLAAASIAMLCAAGFELPAAAVALLLVVLFAWSGVAIHAMPMLLVALVLAIALVGKRAPLVAAAAVLVLFVRLPPLETFTVAHHGFSLAPGQTALVDVARSPSLVVTGSGANVMAMRGGAVGTIDALDATRAVIASRPIAIGDVADWGFMRREHFFTSRNPVPRAPTWRIIGYGASSWLVGAGRIPIDAPGDVATLRITAARSLPADARLTIDTVEMPAR
jgi:hypothetical protein